MKTIEELEAEAAEAEKHIEELNRRKVLKDKIKEAKVLEEEVEPGFFKRAAGTINKMGDGINKLSQSIKIDPPSSSKKGKKSKNSKKTLVYKGIKGFKF